VGVHWDEAPPRWSWGAVPSYCVVRPECGACVFVVSLCGVGVANALTPVRLVTTTSVPVPFGCAPCHGASSRVRCVWGDYEGDGGGNAAAKPAACAVMVAATGGVHTTAARRPRARRPPSAAAPRWGRPPPLAGPGGHGLACGSDAARPPDRMAGHSPSHGQRSRRARRHRRVLRPYV